MPAPRLSLLTPAILLLLAAPVEAQQIAPAISPRDTEPAVHRHFSPLGTVLGGIGGGTLGAVAGFALGAASAQGCHGEECGLASALIGGVLGESVGLAAGAHLGSGSARHEHVVVSAVASTAIFVGTAALGIGMGRFTGGAGAVVIPFTPALQLLAALAIESR